MSISQKFIAESSNKAFDPQQGNIIYKNIHNYNVAVKEGKKQFSNLDLARRRAAMQKHRVLENLEENLKDFESRFLINGGKVIWAQDQEDARKALIQILDSNYVKLVVKNQSLTSQEIGLNEFLEKNGVECVNTDLGEFIAGVANEKPFHSVNPVIHKSAEEVARLFNEKFGLSPESSSEEISAFVRNHVREKIFNAKAVITGASFLVASSGSVAVSENEGSAMLAMSLAPIHIVIAGIEQVIPGTDDLNLFWPLLSTHSTGENLQPYNSLFNGPRQAAETDGPTQMYVILLDNQRSKLLSAIPQRRVLSCINCGACLNACPVYQHAGGHSYATVKKGPVGAVMAPHIYGMEEYKHLSFASSLCGKCTLVCPVNIDLHLQLLHNRNLFVKSRMNTRKERLLMSAWSKIMRKRNWMNKPSGKLKNMALSGFFGKAWGSHRKLPSFAPQSFNELWQQNQEKKFKS